jgi:hypothetical protein
LNAIFLVLLSIPVTLSAGTVFDPYVDYLLGNGPSPEDVNIDGLIDIADPVRLEFVAVGPPASVRLVPEKTEIASGESIDVYLDVLDEDGRIINPGTEGSDLTSLSVGVGVTGPATLNGGQTMITVDIVSPEGGHFTLDAVGVGTAMLSIDPDSSAGAQGIAPHIVPGVNPVTLLESGNISGTVLADPGNGAQPPAPGSVKVQVFDDGGQLLGEGTIDTFDGSYTIKGIRVGTHTVFFSPTESNPDDRFQEPICLTDVAVFSGFSTTDVNATLNLSDGTASIDVMVVDSLGSALSTGVIEATLFATTECGLVYTVEMPIKPDSTATLTGIPPGDITLFARALTQSMETRVLAAPKVVTLNNQEAHIDVFEVVPQVRFEQVTPHLAGRNEGYITLRLKPDVTPFAAEGTYDIRLEDRFGNAIDAGATIATPPLPTQSINTTMLIRDAQTLVVGGLLPPERETDVLFFELDAATLDEMNHLTSEKIPLVFEMEPDPNVIGPPTQVRLTPEFDRTPVGTFVRVTADILDANGRLVNPGTPGAIDLSTRVRLNVDGSATFSINGLQDFENFIGSPRGLTLQIEDLQTEIVTVTADSDGLTGDTETIEFIQGGTISGRAQFDFGSGPENPEPFAAMVFIFGEDDDEPEAFAPVESANGTWSIGKLTPGHKKVVIQGFIFDFMAGTVVPFEPRQIEVDVDEGGQVTGVDATLPLWNDVASASGAIRDTNGNLIAGIINGNYTNLWPDSPVCLPRGGTLFGGPVSSNMYRADVMGPGENRLRLEVTVNDFPEPVVFATNGRGRLIDLFDAEIRLEDLVVAPVGEFTLDDFTPETQIRRFRNEIKLTWTNSDPEFNEYDLTIYDIYGCRVFRVGGLTGNSITLDGDEFDYDCFYEVDLRCYSADGEREARLNVFPRFIYERDLR